MNVLEGKVLIRIEKPEENVGGLILGETWESDGLEKTTVVSIGPLDSQNIEETLSIGDTAFIYAGAGKRFRNPDNGEVYLAQVSRSEIVYFNKN